MGDDQREVSLEEAGTGNPTPRPSVPGQEESYRRPQDDHQERSGALRVSEVPTLMLPRVFPHRPLLDRRGRITYKEIDIRDFM